MLGSDRHQHAGQTAMLFQITHQPALQCLRPASPGVVSLPLLPAPCPLPPAPCLLWVPVPARRGAVAAPPWSWGMLGRRGRPTGATCLCSPARGSRCTACMGMRARWQVRGAGGQGDVRIDTRREGVVLRRGGGLAGMLVPGALCISAVAPTGGPSPPAISTWLPSPLPTPIPTLVLPPPPLPHTQHTTTHHITPPHTYTHIHTHHITFHPTHHTPPPQASWPSSRRW